MNADLMKKCARLTLEEKVQLVEGLTKSIERGRSKTMLRASVLLGVIGRIYGQKVSLHNREAWCVWAKAMVAYRMLQEGYTHGEIGRQLEKDHSTVAHYKRKMEDALSLPHAYQDIIPVWNKFNLLLIP